MAQPRSRSDLFWSFTWLALQGFGGMVAVVQRELVERKQWLTREEFLEEWSVAQVLPGPNVVNLSLMLGGRYFGLGGALSAMAGMLAFPLLIVLSLAAAFTTVASEPAVAGALRGMGAVAAGLITATSLRLAATLKAHLLGPWVCAALAGATFAAIAVWRFPLWWVLPLVGGIGMAWVWLVLGRIPPAGGPRA